MNIYRTKDIGDVNQIVTIHQSSFPGFFLTFLGKGFLKYLYKGFILHSDSGILVAKEESRIVGFLAYSTDLSRFYSYILKRYFIPFAWFGFLGALRSPKSIFRIIRALTYPSAKKGNEKYIEISSIAVDPTVQAQGIGSELIDYIVKLFRESDFQGIQLETDATENDAVNKFYQKNNFMLDREFEANNGRKMNEYRLRYVTERFR